jgi:hypothetical protein
MNKTKIYQNRSWLETNYKILKSIYKVAELCQCHQRTIHNWLIRFGIQRIGLINYKHSDITKSKIGEKSKGRKPMLGKTHSEKTKEIMSLSRQGNVTVNILWQVGTHNLIYNTTGNANWTSLNNNTLWLTVNKGTVNLRTYIDNATANNTVTYGVTTELRANTTTTITPPTFNFYRNNTLLGSGNKNSNWKGGITLSVRLFRKSKQYQQWRSMVLKRDNYCCQICHKPTNIVHHKLSVKDYPELKLKIINGQTLCVEHHKDKHRRWRT